ncbi:TPA: LysE family translocator [Klebsiella pneumoniae]|nr:LysE family translocator [Klebsiella pneumoniae]
MDINLLGFMPALLPVALSPGASFTLVMSSAIAGGRRGLLRILAGTALGIYTHAVLIGLGITAVIISSPATFAVLKISGTVYLLWLGTMLIRSGIRASHGGLTDTKHSVTLREAWIANVLNPKAIIFYLTVVSQFAGKQGGISNYLTLASVHIVVMCVWLLLVSRTLVFSVKKTDPLMLKKYVNIAGGMLLIAFSVHAFIH